MLKTLRRRLTIIFSVLTSLVLGAAVWIGGYVACRQYEQGVEALFSSAFSSLQDKLLHNDTLSDVWLAQQETQTLSLIYIEDNGVPLHFSGAWQPSAGREALLALAQQTLADTPDFLSSRQNAETTFTLCAADGAHYSGAAGLIWRQNGAAASKSILIVLLQDRTAVAHHILWLAACYALLWLGGSAVLALVGWGLAGLALRPTRLALAQQSEFIAAASHELRSPLTVIKASLEAAWESGGVQPAAAGFLEAAEQEADRMKLLTEDLLLLAGSDAHVWRMEAAPLALDTFCIELYDSYYPVAKKQGHALSLDLPEEALPTVSADSQRLRQLFAILLNNALEYAPAGTAIELHAQVLPSFVSLSVADHGRGIPDAEKARVFTRFYRADQSRTDKAHFGLGLAVAKEIADMHHGRLIVRDTPGGGATFVLALPFGGRKAQALSGAAANSCIAAKRGE